MLFLTRRRKPTRWASLILLAAACSDPVSDQPGMGYPENMSTVAGTTAGAMQAGAGTPPIQTAAGPGAASGTGGGLAVDNAGLPGDEDVPATASTPQAPEATTVDCSRLVAAGYELCDQSSDACGVVFHDGSGCSQVCAAANLTCIEGRENIEGTCEADPNRSPIECDSGHDSDYCQCGGPNLTTDTATPSKDAPPEEEAVGEASSAVDSPAVDPNAPLTAVQFYPAHMKEDSCADVALGIRFNRKPLINSGGSIRIHDASGAVVESVTANPKDGLYYSDLQSRSSNGRTFRSDVLDVVYNTVVFQLGRELTHGQTYYVTVDEGLITDSSGTAFSIEADATWRFTVRGTPPASASAYTVAADGSGDYCSVQGALAALPDGATSPRGITIKPGVYPGIVRMSASNVHLRGEGVDRSVIAVKNSTFMNDRDRAGFELSGSDVTFEDLTIFNTYLKDSNGQQAEALYVTRSSAHVFLKNVHLRSHQDTLRVDGSSVYMEGGKISGSTDPLWGTGTFYCDGCELSSRTAGHAFVVARSRTGFALVNCSVTKESAEVRSTYLAQYHLGSEPGKIAFIGCRIDDHIVGWRQPGTNAWYEFDNVALKTGEPVRFNGIQLSAGNAILSEASSAESWLGWAP